MNNEILNVLDTISKQASIAIYIPSLKNIINFKPISTGQQKQILMAAVDNPVFQTRFTVALFQTINENCSEKQLVTKFTTIDSTAITIQLRIATFGPQFALKQNDQTYQIDLNKIVEKIKAGIYTLAPKTITEPPYVIEVSSPLFVEQYNLEKQLRSKDLNDQQVVTAQLSNTIGDAFVGEVSKFIKEITITHDNKQYVVGFKNQMFNDRIAVLEKMPTTAIKSVLNYMSEYVKLQKDILTVSSNDDSVNDLMLPIDTSLFTLG